MNPIRFSIRQEMALKPAAISRNIADTSRWPEFSGYGLLPGIARAEYEVRSESMAGSRIRVRNTDGSSHVETVEIWEPSERILMRLDEFSPPLSRLADHFSEEWLFESQGEITRVVRSFELHPKSALARPALWLISQFFRRAIAKHLAEMAAESRTA